MVRAGVWRVERVDRSCIHNNRGAMAICDRVVCVWNATWMRGLDCGGAFIRARGERGQESADLQGIYAKCWRAWR